jgi:hypothetical protein
MELTIRTTPQREELRCSLRITPALWHLITVRHVGGEGGRVSVGVDGNTEVEGDLFYPFNTPEPAESTWIFGLGMTGHLSSATLYPEDLPPASLALLCSLGPHTSSLLQGPRCPQSSFDTGHLILGTLTAKGALASRLCRTAPLFCVTATQLYDPDQTRDKAQGQGQGQGMGIGQGHAPPLPCTPLVTPGYLFPDHIELQPRTPDHDEPLYW